MEGKKKKNKKKKGNHAKSSDSLSTVEENQSRPMMTMSLTDKPFPNNEHGSHGELNHHGDAPSNVDSQNVEVSESDLEQARCRNLETLCGELQAEVRRLEEEKNTWSQKEGSLEEKILSLQNKVDSCIQRETKLEEKIDVLQNSRASLALQEVILEEKVRKIEGVESWVLEQGSIKKRISKLDDSNRALQIQVRELRESRDGLAHENELLTESISTLASRVECLEMAAFDASLKILEDKLHADPSYAIVEQDDKKEQPLEKVTDIHIEPFQPAVGDGNPTGESSVHESMSVILATPANYQEGVHESSERILVGSTIINGIEDFGSLEQLQQIQLLGLDDSRISEDVVSVPLDDIIQEVQPPKGNMQAGYDAVPLSDAPLIGAPFRLISFVARYVSGADLVDHDKPKTGC